MKSFLDQWSVRISGEEIIQFAKFSDVLYEGQVYPYKCHFDLRRGKGEGGGGGGEGGGGAVLYPNQHFHVHWYLARSCVRTPRKIHCFVMEFGVFKIKRDFCLTVIQTVRNNH